MSAPTDQCRTLSSRSHEEEEQRLPQNTGSRSHLFSPSVEVAAARPSLRHRVVGGTVSRWGRRTGVTGAARPVRSDCCTPCRLSRLPARQGSVTLGPPRRHLLLRAKCPFRPRPVAVRHDAPQDGPDGSCPKPFVMVDFGGRLSPPSPLGRLPWPSRSSLSLSSSPPRAPSSSRP